MFVSIELNCYFNFLILFFSLIQYVLPVSVSLVQCLDVLNESGPTRGAVPGRGEDDIYIRLYFYVSLLKISNYH